VDVVAGKRRWKGADKARKGKRVGRKQDASCQGVTKGKRSPLSSFKREDL